ncbi:MAG TPA: outer membrane beta-barrel protein [Gemmatimonadaceae bacterium]|nr:outer membrane beta-barrel protein [Gemmatimonadaceae bacterium]
MRLHSYFPIPLLSALALATLSPAAHAQSRGSALPSGKAFDLTPYVGYMVFGDLVSGPLGTSLTNAPAPVYGAQLGMRLAPSVSLVGNIATTSSDIEAGIPFLGGFSVARSTMLLYDGGLQLDIPVTTIAGTRMSPFLQAGAGAIRYDISQSFVNTKATNFAANVGLGADVGIGNNIGVRLMAKDYIGKFDFKDATFIDFEGKTAHNFAFSAGLRLSF